MSRRRWLANHHHFCRTVAASWWRRSSSTFVCVLTDHMIICNLSVSSSLWHCDPGQVRALMFYLMSHTVEKSVQAVPHFQNQLRLDDHPVTKAKRVKPHHIHVYVYTSAYTLSCTVMCTVKLKPSLYSLCAPRWVLCNMTSALELGDDQRHFN